MPAAHKGTSEATPSFHKKAFLLLWLTWVSAKTQVMEADTLAVITSFE